MGWRVCDWERRGGEGVAPLRAERPRSGEEAVEEMEVWLLLLLRKRLRNAVLPRGCWEAKEG